MRKAIFIDASHGLGPAGPLDDGAVGVGTTEREQVAAIAGMLLARLRAAPDLAGVRIIGIGVEERLSLRDHIRTINGHCKKNGWKKRDALLLAIHLNRAEDQEERGLEAWFSAAGEEVLDLARLAVGHVSAVAEGLCRAIRVCMGLPPLAGAARPPFYTDVPEDAPYRDDARLCLSEGLFEMTADGQLRPDVPVTRSELAAVCARHLRRHHGVQ